MESVAGNCVSQLNEYQQKAHATVEYEEGSMNGPSHNMSFTMRVIVNGERFPEGTGKTKREAKHNAAKNALEGLKSTHSTESTPSPSENISSVSLSHPNYICWLNEYSQKTKSVFKARESTKMDPGNLTQLCTYVCKYTCGEKEFPEAYGKNKKEAKEAAALRVHEVLIKTPNTAEVLDENSNRAQRSEATSRSASLDRRSSVADDSRSTTPENNYIANLNNFCQKSRRVYDFKLVDRRGPPHNPEFVYKVIMHGKEYPEGLGRSAKEAKQNAAQQAWSEIRDQSGWTTQSSEDGTSSQTPDSSKSEDVQRSLNAPAVTDGSSDFISFRDSAAVNSPMAIIPSVSPLDVKPKIKLAPTFLPPYGLDRSKEGGPDMNLQKPPGGTTSNNSTKSRFLEDFDTINPIGKGGFGRVFKARRKLEDKFYAVKIVKSTEKAKREVGALAGFNNPNIVRYYSSWEEDTAYKHESSESFSDSGSGPGKKFLYIHMEFCEGDTLRAWIKDRNSQNPHFPERRTEAAEICRQLLKAVEYIHSEGLIHRDLKPANIMFSSERTVKVGDFGLVTAAENENDEQRLERTKRTGTRTYMSPEQLNQSTEYNRKVDIYALGLIYFELIWNLNTVHERDKIWNQLRNSVFPPQLTKTFIFEHNLIKKMLSSRPEDRPDASELVRNLDNYTLTKSTQDHRTM